MSETALSHDTPPPGYRANAGVMLIDRRGLVFAGQRADRRDPAWQMPQGGIDKDELPVAAALRELREETGVRTGLVQVIGETPHWLVYDLPAEAAARRWRGRYRGQAQKWVAARFLGEDGDVDLRQDHVEFDDWCWMRADELEALVIGFKRPIYRAVFDAFAAHLAR
ncbi:MAG: RNA pyrophosphohydrolase [Pseudomonadota bacterium]